MTCVPRLLEYHILLVSHVQTPRKVESDKLPADSALKDPQRLWCHAGAVGELEACKLLTHPGQGLQNVLLV